MHCVASKVGSWQGFPSGTVATNRPPMVSFSLVQLSPLGQQAFPGKQRHRFWSTLSETAIEATTDNARRRLLLRDVDMTGFGNVRYRPTGGRILNYQVIESREYQIKKDKTTDRIYSLATISSHRNCVSSHLH